MMRVEYGSLGGPLDTIYAAYLDLTAKLEAGEITFDAALTQLQGKEVVDAEGYTWRVDPVTQSFIRRAPGVGAPWKIADPSSYARHPQQPSDKSVAPAAVRPVSAVGTTRRMPSSARLLSAIVALVLLAGGAVTWWVVAQRPARGPTGIDAAMPGASPTFSPPPTAPSTPTASATPSASADRETVNSKPSSRRARATEQRRGSGSRPRPSAIDQAKAVLQAFIRGKGSGDPSVCERYATESYAIRAFGSVEMCRKDAIYVDEWYRPHEVQAMRTTSVDRGTAADGSVTVRFSDLSWSSGSMTVETVEDLFVLRKVGDRWKIVD